MVRLKTLLFRTDKSRHDRKRKHPTIAKINKATLAIDESGLFMLFTGKAIDLHTHKERRGKSGPYLVLSKLYLDETGKKIANPKCFVHCDCDDFTYRSEVALAMRGSSLIINSNGAMPKYTNPSARPQICKHMLAFLEKCVAYSNTNKNIITNSSPKSVKSDRELIESLRTTRKNPVDVKRMFNSYFKSAGISSTRY